MKITKYLHSCLLIEKDGGRLLFDPGKFSFVEGLVRPERFQSIQAIVLTHGHPDHLHTGALQKIIDANPQVEILTNAETAKTLAAAGINATLHEQGKRAVGTFSLEAIPARHDAILGGDPPQNTAYLIDETLLNPGDSFSPELQPFAGVPVLIVPVMAPWANELQMMAFVEAMQPRVVIPVHDGFSKAFFIAQRFEFLADEFTKRGITLADLQQIGSWVNFNDAGSV
jgi:L-ascorbate metabolism protein UlaG (beta-lactamase superfamily)